MMDLSDHHFRINQPELSRRRHAHLWMTLSLVFTDIASLFLAFGLAIFLYSFIPRGPNIDPSEYLNAAPVVLVFIFFYATAGLYPAVGVSPVDELRLLSRATLTAFILLIVYSFLEQSPDFLRNILPLAIPAVLVLTQLDRWLLRIIARQFGFWGDPVALIGTGRQTQYVETYLRDSIRLGIRPVIMINGHGVPDEKIACILKKTGIHTAVLVVSEMSAEMKTGIIDHRLYSFQHLILIPSLELVHSLSVSTYDLEGMLGLSVQQNLLNRWTKWIKRGLDLSIVFVGGIVTLPLSLIIGLLIRLDSPGKVLYTQERAGFAGKHLKVLKFRTMVSNADQMLQEYLSANPGLRTEWETTQKLKNDPRITRVGKILRKLSLDELPQLWNVLTGEMSIVGPRPIPIPELNSYGDGINLYQLVRPGITGMWQVSGRNDCSYEDRIRYNEYYIRNWSIWLDIYILLRTVWVVLSQRGAY